MKEFLSQQGVQFVERDVSTDRAAAEEMIRRTGQMAVPVVVIGNEVVIGLDRVRLAQLLEKRSKGQRSRFGLQIADASAVASRFGLVPVPGALVGKVAPSSPGEKAGLRPGDIIIEVNSRPIHNAHDLEDTLSVLNTGSHAIIVFLRKQETLKSEITI